MRVFSIILLVVSSAFAYQVTSPDSSQGWNTTGPNYLDWESVSTDPTSFAVFLTNVNTGSSQLLDSQVDGTLGSTVCSPPDGGWPTGSGFRVNLAQDSSHPNSLLAQSAEFNITAVSSNQSTTSPASTQTATSTTSSVSSPDTSTVTTSTPSISSSDTSTTPTGTSAASLSVDIGAGLLTAVAALTALVTSLF